ncbi:MAG TPA: hypothetical protein PLS69_04085 [Terricaulis sp.]|nr:hypothetical protein [Terricaulis sp.]
MIAPLILLAIGATALFTAALARWRHWSWRAAAAAAFTQGVHQWIRCNRFARLYRSASITLTSLGLALLAIAYVLRGV